jgi:Hydrazine synthase alpha subunit middle domain
VEVNAFRKFLKRNDLSVLAIRDVTSRDDQDQQQPFNLKVAGMSHQTINPNAPNTIYEVKHLQFLQNDLIRGIGGINNPYPGRRGIAQFLHDPKAVLYNPPSTGAIGSTNIHADGSAAMIVPAKRALTWQLTDANNKGVVRERLWLSTLPGEIRTCTSCHGESTLNQAGQPSPSNAPQALSTLINYAKTIDTDNDGTKDIYDAYPTDANKHIAEALNENFVTNLSNWLNQNADNDAATWAIQSTITNGSSAVINNRAGADNTGKIDRFRKLINLSNFDGANLTFDLAYARYDASKYDKLRVWAVKCDGTTQLLYDKTSTALATAPDQTSSFMPSSASQWRTESIDLSAFVGKTIELVFENIGGFGNQLFIDNILIKETAPPTPCPNTRSFSGDVMAGLYVSAQTIQSQAGQSTKVLPGSNVVFSSGNSILLQAGFEVKKGSIFKATIGGCN